MHLEHHLVGGYVRYISPHTCIIIIRTMASHKDWVFSPYLIAWDFPVWVYPPTSKTEHFLLFPMEHTHPVIGTSTLLDV